jgi:hypothetical protein
MLLVGQVSGRVQPSNFSGKTLNEASAMCQNYKIISLRTGGLVTWRPTDQTDMDEFRTIDPPATTVALTATLFFPYLIAIVYGGTAAGTYCLAEVACNFEGTYRDQTFLPGGVTAAPAVEPVDGWYTKVQRAIEYAPQMGSLLTEAVSGYQQGGLFGAVSGVIRANGIAYPANLVGSGVPRIAYH